MKDGVLNAAEIRREQVSDDGEVREDVELRGRVQTFDDDDPSKRSFTIMGLAVPTNTETDFDDMGLVGESIFYAFLADPANADALLDVRDETDAPDDPATTLDFADRVRVRDDN